MDVGAVKGEWGASPEVVPMQEPAGRPGAEQWRLEGRLEGRQVLAMVVCTLWPASDLATQQLPSECLGGGLLTCAPEGVRTAPRPFSEGSGLCRSHLLCVPSVS